MIRKVIDRSVLTGIIFFSIFLCFEALEFPNKGGWFPIFSLVCIILLSMFTLGHDIFSRNREAFTAEDEDEAATEEVSLSRPMLLFGLTVVQVLLMPLVGFYSTTAVFIVVAGYCIGLRKLRLVAAISLILMTLFYLFFEVALRFEFPRGLLF